MGIVSALVALLRAVPSLERLFLRVSDQLREAKAKNRYDAKLDAIDTAMRNHGLPDGNGGVRQHEETDGTPSVSEGGIQRTGLHTGRTEDDSRT